jgi:hypothetical protein
MVLLLLGSCYVASAFSSALRIMPLGDSITQWHCGLESGGDNGDVASFGGYRGFLFKI